MDRWKPYLFERHSKGELRDWVRRLQLFRFLRAYGGYANDADSLDCTFSYQAESDLERLFSAAGIQAIRFDAKLLNLNLAFPMRAMHLRASRLSSETRNGYTEPTIARLQTVRLLSGARLSK